MMNTINSLLLIVLLVLFFFIKPNADGYFLCTADNHLYINNGEAVLDSNISFFIDKSGGGNYKNLGRAFIKDKKYEVNRILYFSYTFKAGIYYINIIDSKKNGNDTIPEELYELYFLPNIKGVEFPIIIKRVNNNALVISGIENTYSVCKF